MIRDVTPLLAVADVDAACAFMEGCLGFRTGFRMPGFAWCGRDGGAIRFIAAKPGVDVENPALQVAIYIDADDVDALWAEHADAILALPDTHRQPPADTDHGQREFVLVHGPFMFVAGQPNSQVGA